jgi:hypothetical protein
VLGLQQGPEVNQQRNTTDSRKQAVSIRMNRSDVRNIKRLAERLGARDSDVIRFAIKLMLAQLAPLQDPSVGGRGLVSVFVESGPELMRHFELDSSRLASIINDGVDADRQVAPDDIQLIAMSALQRSYVKLRSNSAGTRNGGAATEAPEQSLRQYLYEKYLHSSAVGHGLGALGSDT